MQIKVVPHREDIAVLEANERIVHLAFRPDIKDILNILDACPKIQAIEVPKSYYNTLCKAVPILLQMRKVDLIAGEVQGHRRDLNAYYTIPAQVLEIVKERRAAGTPAELIEREIKKTHLVNSDLAAFIVKNYTVPA